jgi:hypothetical protein
VLSQFAVLVGDVENAAFDKSRAVQDRRHHAEARRARIDACAPEVSMPQHLRLGLIAAEINLGRRGRRWDGCLHSVSVQSRCRAAGCGSSISQTQTSSIPLPLRS